MAVYGYYLLGRLTSPHYNACWLHFVCMCCFFLNFHVVKLFQILIWFWERREYFVCLSREMVLMVLCLARFASINKFILAHLGIILSDNAHKCVSLVFFSSFSSVSFSFSVFLFQIGSLSFRPFLFAKNLTNVSIFAYFDNINA